MSLIFVMVDGVGLAPCASHNPVATGMPGLRSLLGAPLDDALWIETPALHAVPIDATLGIAGLPQSGTGHTAIYGGFNAAALNGRHQPGYPTAAMRDNLARHNVFRVASEAGYRVAWANAYLPGYGQAVERRRLRHTAGTWGAMEAGLELRGLEHLLAGTAVSWDITQSMARSRPGCGDLTLISPESAGQRLVRLAATHDLVAFETYLPDLAGHGRIPHTPEEALAVVDGLLVGVAEARRPEDTLVMTSDHGNVEDARTHVHTRHPVPLVSLGPAAGVFARVRAIDGVMEALLEALRTSNEQHAYS